MLCFTELKGWQLLVRVDNGQPAVAGVLDLAAGTLDIYGKRIRTNVRFLLVIVIENVGHLDKAKGNKK